MSCVRIFLCYTPSIRRLCFAMTWSKKNSHTSTVPDENNNNNNLKRSQLVCAKKEQKAQTADQQQNEREAKRTHWAT